MVYNCCVLIISLRSWKSQTSLVRNLWKSTIGFDSVASGPPFWHQQTLSWYPQIASQGKAVQIIYYECDLLAVLIFHPSKLRFGVT